MTEAPLRVLFLTPYFRPYLGGIERAIEQLTFQIQKYDLMVRLLIFQRHPRMQQENL